MYRRKLRHHQYTDLLLSGRMSSTGAVKPNAKTRACKLCTLVQDLVALGDWHEGCAEVGVSPHCRKGFVGWNDCYRILLSNLKDICGS